MNSLTLVLTASDPSNFAALCEDFISFFKRSMKGVWTNIHVPIRTIPAKGGRYYNSSSYEKWLKDYRDGTNQARNRQYLMNAIIEISQGYNVGYNPQDGFFKKDSPTTLHFVTYYWYDQKINQGDWRSRVDMAYLSIDYQRTNKQDVLYSATLELYFHRSHQGGSMTKFSGDIRSDLTERMGTSLILRMRDSKIPKVMSQWIFFVGEEEPEDWNVLLGTYSTVGRLTTNSQPSAGIALLEKMDSKAECLNRIQNHTVSDYIYHYLFRSRLSVPNSVAETAQSLPNEVKQEVDQISPYTGTYQCYIISKADGETNLLSFICRFHGNSEAEVLVKNPRSHSLSLYHGRIRIGPNKSIICYFDLIGDRRFHRFNFYIDNRKQSSEKMLNAGFSLYGVYAGIEESDRVPFAGRIKLTRVGDVLPGENWSKQYDALLKSISEYEEEFHSLLRNDEDLRLFLSGRYKINYIEALPETRDQLADLEDQLQELKKENERLRSKLQYVNRTN